MDYPNVRVINTDGIGADLRDDGLYALTNRGDAGHHLKRTVGHHFDSNGVERAEPAFLDEHGDAGADLLAILAPPAMLLLKLVPARGFQRFVEQKLIVTGIVDDLSTECVKAERIGHRAFADQIAPANFNAVDSNFGGDCIQPAL